MAFSFPKTASTFLFLLFTLIFFFLLLSNHLPPSTIHRRSLLNTTTCSHILQIQPNQRCSFSTHHCSVDSNGLLNYFSFHFCHFHQNPFLSIPFLSLTVVLQFYILVKTAQDQFSVVVTKLATHLNLSPSMGAVTLLALGNGAPDVFASIAAVGGGNARTGFGAILSAGTFVSALVVGFVAIYAAPFAVSPAPFIRDVLFYLTAALFLFYVYLSAEIFLWQAVGFVGFYLAFVGFVFWMDFGMDTGGKSKVGSREVVGLVGDGYDDHKGSMEIDSENGSNGMDFTKKKTGFGFRQAFEKQISKIWEFPVSTMLKLTIPQASPSEWSRLYRSANIALCPLALIGKKAPKNRTNARSAYGIYYECVLDFHHGRRTPQLSCSTRITYGGASITSWLNCVSLGEFSGGSRGRCCCGQSRPTGYGHGWMLRWSDVQYAFWARNGFSDTDG
ncbi:cation/calcium exchanger 5 isoform X3 [Cynara cardunculus var. scolymus]|uniref:cation/calcium exchanger 5 isoform X3 n=1 Tax=Cynara cardunculus var. scolymus TaxID=59895 RepID=UPI000D6258A3|nr:cation/calcium exchanger 5 isoform X3 [Cynara cardunculus var. scolymus]